MDIKVSCSERLPSGGVCGQNCYRGYTDDGSAYWSCPSHGVELNRIEELKAMGQVVK